MTVPRWLRATVVLAASVWIIGGPFYRQVLGGSWPGLRAWRMFHARGLDLVEVRFETVKDGVTTPIERFATLGRKQWDAPLNERRIVGRAGLETVARALCQKLGPGADLRAHARLAVPAGWQPLEDGQRNLCAGRR